MEADVEIKDPVGWGLGLIGLEDHGPLLIP